MTLGIYSLPDPTNPLELLPCEKSVADLLLNFDHPRAAENTISKIIAINNSPDYLTYFELPVRAVALQIYEYAEVSLEWRSYVRNRTNDQLYQFRGALVPIREPVKRFSKAGFKGLFFGADEAAAICQVIP